MGVDWGDKGLTTDASIFQLAFFLLGVFLIPGRLRGPFRVWDTEAGQSGPSGAHESESGPGSKSDPSDVQMVGSCCFWGAVGSLGCTGGTKGPSKEQMGSGDSPLSTVGGQFGAASAPVLCLLWNLLEDFCAVAEEQSGACQGIQYRC